jgi:hypothetical protein
MVLDALQAQLMLAENSGHWDFRPLLWLWASSHQQQQGQQ